MVLWFVVAGRGMVSVKACLVLVYVQHVHADHGVLLTAKLFSQLEHFKYCALTDSLMAVEKEDGWRQVVWRLYTRA